MRLAFIVLVGLGIFSFLLLQSTYAQPENTTKFNVLTFSNHLDREGNLIAEGKMNKTVGTIEEALNISNAGLINKEAGKSIIIVNDSVQVVDNNVAPDVLEKTLKDLVDIPNPPKQISSYYAWVCIATDPPHCVHLDIFIQ